MGIVFKLTLVIGALVSLAVTVVLRCFRECILFEGVGM